MNATSLRARGARVFVCAGWLAVVGLIGAPSATAAPESAGTAKAAAQTLGGSANGYDGTNDTDLVYDRVEQDCTTPGAALAVEYSVQPFMVEADGMYDFDSTQDYDGFVALYEGGFDPTDPALNCLAADDDGGGGIGTSEFSANLVAGTPYFLVTSAFDDPDVGTFSNLVQGPGEIVLGASFTGVTSVNSPTYLRPEESCFTQIATPVPYRTNPFVVDQDGIYHIASIQNYDGTLHLYSGAFNRSDPSGDCLGGDDDGFNGIGTSDFDAQLRAGVPYVLVTSGYDDQDTGIATNMISGPGRVGPGGVSYSGSTVGAPTFDRAVADCSSISGIGVGVGYHQQNLLVDQPGDYSFNSFQDYDGFLHLYGIFDPMDALSGCLAGNDDDIPGIGTSRFTYAPAEAYGSLALVTSQYSPDGAGDFVNLVSGDASSRVALFNRLAGYGGSTTGEPTFFRPFYFDCSRTSATNAPYQVTEFTVNRSGNYAFASSQTGWDGYVLLYEAPFEPADGTFNCLEGNDDGPNGIGTSYFIASPLKAFRRYALVVTGFSPADSGDYSLIIGGPATVGLGDDSIFGSGYDGE